MTHPTAEIGVFGGSGFYSLLSDAREYKVDTPYGAPSAPVTVGEIGGRSVAFLPRHGKEHTLPPHMIDYRANVWAMKQLGVGRIIGPNACGSLQSHVKPGEFVICDQFVDRTSGRKDTFYDGPTTTHVSSADPYCPVMRGVAVDKARELGITVHPTGTVVVIQGPRFSTRAESRWFAAQGWEVINMTQYPECYLARELEICYCNISLITDHDAGADGAEPVTNDEVVRVFNENNAKVRDLLFAMIPALPVDRECVCAHGLEGAAF
ncbi:MAG: S-methyl-5'-thioadenosine phosphorylase [Coriobacteriia bacterium]